MELTPETIYLGLIWYVVFLFSTTLHEAAHATAALRLGDPTAYRTGQVSLNPWPHLRREPFGMLLIPLLSFAWSGWMMGWASAPYDPLWADRHPRRAAAMAAAGPASNLLLVLVAALGIRAGIATGALLLPDGLGGGLLPLDRLVMAAEPGPATAIASLLSILFSLNLVLFAFNLLPLPPLDGSGILPILLPPPAARAYRNLLHQPMVGLLGIILAWKVFGRFFPVVYGGALKWLYAGLLVS